MVVTDAHNETSKVTATNVCVNTTLEVRLPVADCHRDETEVQNFELEYKQQSAWCQVTYQRSEQFKRALSVGKTVVIVS